MIYASFRSVSERGCVRKRLCQKEVVSGLELFSLELALLLVVKILKFYCGKGQYDGFGGCRIDFFGTFGSVWC